MDKLKKLIMIENKKYEIKKDREERILEALEMIAKQLERMANMTENTYLENKQNPSL